MTSVSVPLPPSTRNTGRLPTRSEKLGVFTNLSALGTLGSFYMVAMAKSKCSSPLTQEQFLSVKEPGFFTGMTHLRPFQRSLPSTRMSLLWDRGTSCLDVPKKDHFCSIDSKGHYHDHTENNDLGPEEPQTEVQVGMKSESLMRHLRS